ncbi:MAG: DUF1707 domain-containing protein [Nocardioides sp.]
MSSLVPWHDFSADPRRPESAPLRASDADRAVVLAALGDAYADGRLTKEEYDERSTEAGLARTLGDLPPLLADLVSLDPRHAGAELSPRMRDDIAAKALSHWQKQRTEALNGFLFITVVTWVIWAATSGVGSFPWPIFPTLFVGLRLPQVMLNKRDIVEKERARLEKKQRKALESGREDPSGD